VLYEIRTVLPEQLKRAEEQFNLNKVLYQILLVSTLAAHPLPCYVLERHLPATLQYFSLLINVTSCIQGSL